MKTLFYILAVTAVLSTARAADADDPIRIDAPELAKMDFSRTDGGLEPVAGLRTFVLLRADKERPELSDCSGLDLSPSSGFGLLEGQAVRGLEFNERDEDTGMSRELYRTSADGEHWSPLAELFPAGRVHAAADVFFPRPQRPDAGHRRPAHRSRKDRRADKGSACGPRNPAPITRWAKCSRCARRPKLSRSWGDSCTAASGFAERDRSTTPVPTRGPAAVVRHGQGRGLCRGLPAIAGRPPVSRTAGLRQSAPARRANKMARPGSLDRR